MPKLILVVDDEPDLREMLYELLLDEGYTCLLASSPSEAIQQINNCESQNSNIDLIVSDINMPGGSGVDLLKTIRKSNNEAPILFLSGDSADEILKPYLNLGVSGYQLKPFRSHELLVRIKKIIG